MIWENKIFKAKNETVEFLTADSLIFGGGFIVGTQLPNSEISTPLGLILLVIGLFLGVRVLWKFSSNLKNNRESIQLSVELLKTLLGLVKENYESLETANEGLEENQEQLDNTKDEIYEAKRDILSTKAELEKNMTSTRIVLESVAKLNNELSPRNTSRSNPNLLITRFMNIENFTMFDLEKQPILNMYTSLIPKDTKINPKMIQDFKLIKLFSLLYNLVWLNKTILPYNGHRINYEPLITLVSHKNRYNQLYKLKIYEYSGEIDLELEQKMERMVGLCYNSMIDSQDLRDLSHDPPMMAKEHFIKVSEVNEKFEELAYEINEFLTIKFPKDKYEAIKKITISF